MDFDFKRDLDAFIAKFKADAAEHQGNKPFESLMRGLSDGSIEFRWNFGGRFVEHDPIDTDVNWMPLRYLISAPFIYAMILPIVVLDLSVSLYQAICFRLWKVPQVRRSEYVIIDRHRLSYLSPFQKLNCIYCGYANGVFAYARMIAGQTERFWCPIKHDQNLPSPHAFYLEFADYKDETGWRQRAAETNLVNSEPNA